MEQPWGRASEPGCPALKLIESVGRDNKLGKTGLILRERVVFSKGKCTRVRKALLEQDAYISILNAEGLGEVIG